MTFRTRSLAAVLPLVLAFVGARAHAQAMPGAERGGQLAAGVTYTSVQTDEAQKRIQGIGIFADFDLSRHLGLEANVKIPGLSKPEHFTENTYTIGARYIYHIRRYTPYVRIAVGLGSTSTDNDYRFPGTPGTYGLYSLGGGLDIRITEKVGVRAIDFEEQRWINFPQNFKGSTLDPSAISAGVTYRFR